MTEETELAVLCELGEIQAWAGGLSRRARAQGKLPLAEQAGRLQLFVSGELHKRLDGLL